MARKTIVVCDNCGQDKPVRKYKIQVTSQPDPRSRQLDLCDDCSEVVTIGSVLSGPAKRRARFRVTSEAEFLAAQQEAGAPPQRAAKKAAPSSRAKRQR